jgi:hypothetical protein
LKTVPNSTGIVGDKTEPADSELTPFDGNVGAIQVLNREVRFPNHADSGRGVPLTTVEFLAKEIIQFANTLETRSNPMLVGTARKAKAESGENPPSAEAGLDDQSKKNRRGEAGGIRRRAVREPAVARRPVPMRPAAERVPAVRAGAGGLRRRSGCVIS